MINVTKPYLPNRDKLNKYIDIIYETGWIANNGPLLKTLEKKLASYLGVKNIILVANGTLALSVAYKALKLKNEVITTPFSFVATTSTLIWDNLTPIFCDIDKNSLTLDYTKIAPLISNKTSAIVATHIFGNACEIEKIEKIAKENNLIVIYDASHCFDVKYNNKSILSYGDVSTISFHATKLFHTIEGGAIVTNDDDLAKQIRLYINFGISGPEQIETLGINAKMNEFQAAMGLSLLDDIELIKQKREDIWKFYNNNIPAHLQIQRWNEKSTRNHSYFPIILNDEDELLRIVVKLNENEIYPRRYFNPSLNKLDYITTKQECPVSEDIASRILAIPIYPELLKEEAIKIVKIINEPL